MNAPRRGFPQDLGVPGMDPVDWDLWKQAEGGHGSHRADPVFYMRPDECSACEWLLQALTTRSLDLVLTRRLG